MAWCTVVMLHEHEAWPRASSTSRCAAPPLIVTVTDAPQTILCAYPAYWQRHAAPAGFHFAAQPPQRATIPPRSSVCTVLGPCSGSFELGHNNAESTDCVVSKPANEPAAACPACRAVCSEVVASEQQCMNQRHCIAVHLTNRKLLRLVSGVASAAVVKKRADFGTGKKARP